MWIEIHLILERVAYEHAYISTYPPYCGKSKNCGGGNEEVREFPVELTNRTPASHSGVPIPGRT
jgi:hypothetical protein